MDPLKWYLNIVHFIKYEQPIPVFPPPSKRCCCLSYGEDKLEILLHLRNMLKTENIRKGLQNNRLVSRIDFTIKPFFFQYSLFQKNVSHIILD